MANWVKESVFYHLYPLGLCGAPHKNDLSSPEINRLNQIFQWTEYIKEMGINAVFLGPLFESSSHGYDTVDHNRVDRRLGNNGDLKALVKEFHKMGMKVVLDGVFNHVGRDFYAFRDLREKGSYSQYADWFHGVNFMGSTPYNDPFSYDTWNNHYELVKLNLKNHNVKNYIYRAVKNWIADIGIDGLRLDVADNLDGEFQEELSQVCKGMKSDFWLMGEVVHGDYRNWVRNGKLDSVTNYECYKGLYSSHNDANYFEIAYSLNRQFGEGGVYRDMPLYSFADNHDVNRVMGDLNENAHAYPLYCILFSMPGVPSVYYGSEWGLDERKAGDSDWNLRPSLNLEDLKKRVEYQSLYDAISRLIKIRRESHALNHGSYRQLHVNHRSFAFERKSEKEKMIVAVSSDFSTIPLEIQVDDPDGTVYRDLLNRGEEFVSANGRIYLDLYPNWGRILRKI